MVMKGASVERILPQVNPFVSPFVTSRHEGSVSEMDRVVDSVDVEEQDDVWDDVVHSPTVADTVVAPSKLCTTRSHHVLDCQVPKQGNGFHGTQSTSNVADNSGQLNSLNKLNDGSSIYSDSSNDNSSDSSNDSSNDSSPNDKNIFVSDSSGSSDSDDDLIVFPHEFSDKKRKLLQWKVRRATCAVRDYCLANSLKKADDYEFHWAESSDEYRYLYQRDITPFVNIVGENVSMHQIIAKRNALTLQDYASFKRNGELAAKGLERRKRFELEWDVYRLYESDTVLPFIDLTGKMISTNDILAQREQKKEEVANGTNSERTDSVGIHVKRKLDVLQRKQQEAEYELMLHTEGSSPCQPISKAKKESEASSFKKTNPSTGVGNINDEPHGREFKNVSSNLIARCDEADNDHCVSKTMPVDVSTEKSHIKVMDNKSREQSNIEAKGKNGSVALDKKKLKLQSAGNGFVMKYEEALEESDVSLLSKKDNEAHLSPKTFERTALKSAGNTFLTKYEKALESETTHGE
jgi:hypothetical protein